MNLFGENENSQFNRRDVAERIASLASSGVYVGTSSWKYRGWCNLLYDEQRYIRKGQFGEKRFEENCLSEYAEVFKTVCVDAAYYKFPERAYLENLASAVPADFRFGFKATDEITIKQFPGLARFGARAGKMNERFLNANMFADFFLKPCESIREKVGVLIFEFSQFSEDHYKTCQDFIADLDRFLLALPKGWPYAIEIRNRDWLQADYFACLAKHEVAHVFNAWDAMPPVGEQMAISESRTNPYLVAARLLLASNRKYKEAVDLFKPYQKVKEINESARLAAAALIEEGRKQPRQKTFAFVNNRLEGNALETIAAILGKLQII